MRIKLGRLILGLMEVSAIILTNYKGWQSYGEQSTLLSSLSIGLSPKMVEQIEDPLSSGTCESINNWVESKKIFRNAVATLCAHKIGKLSG